jgi:hypothetical protein
MKQATEEINNRKYVDILFAIFQAEGFYAPHITATMSSNTAINQKQGGVFTSDLILSVKTDICAKPPSKKKVLCRLYELLYEADMIYSGQIVGAETLPLNWIWRLIENISKPCEHADLVHNA